MATVTVNATLKSVLDEADPNKISDAFRDVAMGTLLDPIEETVDISAAAATTINLATQSAALKGALLVQSVEVLTGAAAAGSRIVVPSTDAASTTEVVLSADGTTLTFEANVETVRVRWIAASKTALTTDFPTTGVG
jgi:hypothetical protein